MDEKIQQKILKYTAYVTDEYRKNNPEAFNKLFEIQQKNNYILGVGFGRKITASEQECAKVCLQNLGLDLNY
jgi:hypothetical protein